MGHYFSKPKILPHQGIIQLLRRQKEVESSHCEQSMQGTLVHSTQLRWSKLGQNWVKIGPRSFWMVPSQPQLAKMHFPLSFPVFSEEEPDLNNELEVSVSV